MPRPTEEELSNYEPSAEEEAAYAEAERQLAKALDRARIPADFDWAYIELAVAAQIAHLVGLDRDTFVGGVEIVNEDLCDAPRSARPRIHDIEPGSFKPRLNRVFNAIQAAKIAFDVDLVMHLASLAGSIMHRNGARAEHITHAANDCYTMAEKAAAAAAHRAGRTS